MNIIHNPHFIDFMDYPFIDTRKDIVDKWKWLNFASGWYGFNVRRRGMNGIYIMPNGGIRQNFMENQNHIFSTVFFEMKIRKDSNYSPDISVVIIKTDETILCPKLGKEMHYANYNKDSREWHLVGEIEVNESIKELSIMNFDADEVEVNNVCFSPIPFHDRVLGSHGYVHGNNCRDHIDFIDVFPHTGISTHVHKIEFDVPLLSCPTVKIKNVDKNAKGVCNIVDVTFGANFDKAVLTVSTCNIEKKSCFMAYFGIEPFELT